MIDDGIRDESAGYVNVSGCRIVVIFVCEFLDAVFVLAGVGLGPIVIHAGIEDGLVRYSAVGVGVLPCCLAGHFLFHSEDAGHFYVRTSAVTLVVGTVLADLGPNP